MNCIFILLCLLQIVYSFMYQNKFSYKSAKDLQTQTNTMSKGPTDRNYPSNTSTTDSQMQNELMSNSMY
uniref:Uncharacterized protein n=1 Tax=Octopus bimaculoides TaxID=37653 RepID=A0A0L8GHW0_OCTBM